MDDNKLEWVNLQATIGRFFPELERAEFCPGIADLTSRKTSELSFGHMNDVTCLSLTSPHGHHLASLHVLILSSKASGVLF
ncbi:hypothetical protein Pcac1_g2022 [Phytophthora cactorum]|nr:hypothetical protein Pcac1_g2022 [Phytophthora cactorum]KAG2960880.1 hypothetical protein PC119_g26273 [Phytophthora cactorum]KAG3123719.1 hypothetical protein C6341_g26442 [Phytophthora cactorum]KAG4037823.1 hypothetical protein PC123_g26612 [Phytophthora cactorum]